MGFRINIAAIAISKQHCHLLSRWEAIVQQVLKAGLPRLADQPDEPSNVEPSPAAVDPVPPEEPAEGSSSSDSCSEGD